MSGHPRREAERLSAVIDAIAVHAGRYERYADDLRRARAEQAALRLLRPGARPRLDDMEAELSYLRLRALKPSTVFQVGCRDGWTAAWLLRALRDNGGGRLHSFDRTDRARANVPDDLAAGRWTIIAGDVRAGIDRAPRPIDYLFVDGERSARFARWYLPNLVAPLAPGTPVSVHGVFRHRRPRPFGEASLLLHWLGRNRTGYFTASPAREPAAHRQLERVRRALGLDDSVHAGRRNPMVFFQAA